MKFWKKKVNSLINKNMLLEKELNNFEIKTYNLKEKNSSLEKGRDKQKTNEKEASSSNTQVSNELKNENMKLKIEDLTKIVTDKS